MIVAGRVHGVVEGSFLMGTLLIVYVKMNAKLKTPVCVLVLVMSRVYHCVNAYMGMVSRCVGIIEFVIASCGKHPPTLYLSQPLQTT